MFNKHPRKVQLNNFVPSLVEVEERVNDGKKVLGVIGRKPLTRDYFKPLPSPDTFSIEAYQSAGIPLKQVNTKVLTPSDSVVEEHLINVLNQLEEDPKPNNE